MIADCEDKEKKGKLNDNPPPSPADSKGCTIIEKPADEALAQPLKVAEEA